MWLYPGDFQTPNDEPDWDPEWDFEKENYPEALEDDGTFIAEDGQVLLDCQRKFRGEVYASPSL